MRSSLQALLCCACLFFSFCAQAGESVSQSFHSRILGRDYRYQVYLPDGYANDARHYPVLYLLHGAGGDENEWLDGGGVRETLDRLVAAGTVQPMVVIMPGHAKGWWVDGAQDKAETALLQELLPHAEGHFRVQAAPHQRLVAGVSAGGYGALNLVLKYPQLFKAAALLSPAIYDPLPPLHSSATRQPPFQRDGKFDPQRWQSLNYTAHIEGYKKSGSIVPLHIQSGDRDNFGIALQSAKLFETLRLHQPGAIALRIVDGDHDWALWRNALPGALQFLNAHLQSAQPPEAMRVMSYNIRCGSCERETDVNHWSRRKYLVADVIKNAQADVIGLQEAELFQVHDLVSLLGDFDWVGAGRDDGKEKGEINAVLVRRSALSITSNKTLWLSETPQTVSRGWDAMFNRTVAVLALKSRATGRGLNFLNSHFDHAGVVARNESARLIETLVQSLDANWPVILTGDFNARSDFAGYQNLTRPLRDAATASQAPATGGNITFNGFGRDVQADNKIDYIFVSPGVEVKTHRVVTDLYNGLYPSDHFPLVVDVLLH